MTMASCNPLVVPAMGCGVLGTGSEHDGGILYLQREDIARTLLATIPSEILLDRRMAERG